MPTYEEWLAQQNLAQTQAQAQAQAQAQEQEQQPAQPIPENQPTEYTYIPRFSANSAQPPTTSAIQPPVTSNIPAVPRHFQYAPYGGNYFMPGHYFAYYPIQFDYPAMRPIHSHGLPHQSLVMPVPTHHHYTTTYLPVQATTPASSSSVTAALRNGTVPWYGRTRAEVDADNMSLAARTTAGNPVEWKPTARASDLFWVWEPDGTTRNLYTFAAIESNFAGGKWHIDGSNGVAFYVRAKN